MANDILELLIKASVSSDGGLDKIDAAIKQIGKDSGLTGQALSNLQSRVSSEFQKMTAAGLNFEQQIKRLSQAGDTMGRGVSGSAKEIAKDLQDAANAAKNAQTQVNATKQALGGIQGATTNPFGALTNSASSFASTLGPLGLAIGGVVTVATLGAKAMFDLVDSQGKAAQQTVNMATQMGITAGAMKKLQVEGELIGVSFQTMQMASRQLANALEDPTGAGKRAAQALRDLGISTQTLSGGLRGEGEVFQDTIEHLARMTDHTKQVEEATRLFGARGSASLQLVINRYKELDETARNLGYGDTTQLQQELAKGEEKINAMSAAWDLFKSKLAQQLEPIVIPVVAAISWLITPEKGARAAFGVSGANQPAFETTGKRQAREQLEDLVLGARSSVEHQVADAERKRQEADVTAANLLGQNYQTQRAQSPDGRKEALSGLQSELTKASVEISQTGEGTTEKQAAISKAKGIQAQIDAIKAQEKAEKDYEQTRKRVEELDNRANVSGLTGLQKLEEERKNSLKTLGTTAEFIARINADYAKMESQEKKNEADKLAKLDRSLNASALREDLNRQGRLAQKDGSDDPQAAYQARIALAQQLFETDSRNAATLEEKNRIAQQYYNTAKDAEASLTEEKRKQLKVTEQIQFNESLHLIQLQRQTELSSSERAGRGRSSSLRLAGLDTTAEDANDRISALQSSRDAELSQLNALYSQLGNSPEKEKERSDIRLKSLDLVAKTEQQIADTREQAEEKIAELRQKELDGYKKQADQIFDALRTPGSQGIRSFLNAQGTDLARTLFSNASAPILQTFGHAAGGLITGQTATDAQGNETRTALGKLLQGTIFDSAKSGKAPQVVALDANTQALNRLTGAFTGKSIGGTPAPSPDPTSIAGVVAQEATGGLASVAPSAVASVQAAQLAGMTADANVAGDSQFGITAAKLLSQQQQINSQNPLSQFMTGASSGIGNWGEIFHGDTTQTLADGSTITTAVSPSQQAGAAVGTGAALAGGAYEAYNSFSQGGVRGALGGIAATSGVAALLDPEPVSKAVLGATAAISGILGSVITTSKDIREASIANQIAYEQYLAPATMNRSLSASGGFEQVNDKYGMPSATSYTSVTKSQPYKYLSPIQTPGSLYQNWLYQAGTVNEPYQNPAPIPTYANPTGNNAAPIVINNHISAVDQASFNSFGPKIATSLQQQVLEGHPVAVSLQRAILGA